MIPLEALWLDTEGVGMMLSKSAKEVRERIVAEPDFPTPSQLGKRNRWLASEVHEWMLKKREAKGPGRPREA